MSPKINLYRTSAMMNEYFIRFLLMGFSSVLQTRGPVGNGCLSKVPRVAVPEMTYFYFYFLGFYFNILCYYFSKLCIDNVFFPCGLTLLGKNKSNSTNNT